MKLRDFESLYSVLGCVVVWRVLRRFFPFLLDCPFWCVIEGRATKNAGTPHASVVVPATYCDVPR